MGLKTFVVPLPVSPLLLPVIPEPELSPLSEEGVVSVASLEEFSDIFRLKVLAFVFGKMESDLNAAWNFGVFGVIATLMGTIGFTGDWASECLR